MFKLYFDEDSLDRAVIAGARRLAFDCSSVADEGRWAASDADQLQFAADSRRVLFNRNVGHFAQLHWAWIDAGRSHAGHHRAHRTRHADRVRLRALARLGAEIDEQRMVNSFVYLSCFARLG